jgi:hypothetical protein
MKDKFHTFRGKRGLDVANICDDVFVIFNEGIGLQIIEEMSQG